MVIVFLILSVLLFGIFSGVEIVFTSGRILNYKANDYNTSTITLARKYTQNPTIELISCLLVKFISFSFITLFIIFKVKELLTTWSDKQNLFNISTILALAILATVVVLLEFLPKNLSRLYAENIIPIFSFFIIPIQKILYFPSFFIRNINSFILQSFQIKTSSINIGYTALDIEKLIKEHHTNEDENGELDTEMFENVLFLKNIKVRECMIPRNEISAIEVDEPIDQLKKIIIETYHSRILVYKDTIDNVIGYVHHFDLHEHPKSISEILIPIKIVPEAMPVQILMDELIKDNKSIAWVVNEYGGTAGVVTLEDILEEIFGEIDDEYDDDEYIERQLSKNEFILSGRLEIDRINEEYNLHIPEGEYETLSGLIVSKTGSIPAEKDEIQIGDYLFKIMNVSDTKVETIKLTVLDSTNHEE